ncbi:MAG TPA: methylenetetrahydrofolate reductase, partial [Thermotogota bacterium]|nr:methylenetetrahydrofolate reductase [Thermotogota bacterium]
FDLIEYVKRDGRFCIGAAAYPEGYADTMDVDLSIQYLKKKADVGADFFITQLFYDNDRFFRFLDKAQSANISQPIIPGIMPILRNTNLKRILNLSSTSIPASLQEKIDRFGKDPLDLEKVGIDHAAKQIKNLRERGIKHIHLYTMNKSRQIIEICRLSEAVS